MSAVSTVGTGDSMIEVVLVAEALAATLTVIAETSPETRNVAGGTAVVSAVEIAESRAFNLEDVVSFVPGVFARSRFGADETQFSVRGSGLRNNFHHRGLNLLINGVPYQDSDGFGDFESLEMFATERIQIWKGANALQYGGSSMGGAINFVTYDGATGPPLQVRAEGGSHGLVKGQIAAAYLRDSFRYYVSVSNSRLDGYRDHSGQERTRLFGNLDWQPGTATTARFDLIYADVSEELPGALTAAEFEAAPRQADPVNVQNRWGRSFDYYRGAFQILHSFDDRHQTGFYLHGQLRDMVHPIFLILEQEALHYGSELNYRVHSTIGNRENRFVAGLSWVDGESQEQRFVNAAGSSGPLAADFTATASSIAVYFENQFEVSERLTINAGGRVESASRQYRDHFLADGDRSDERRYEAFSPRVGLLMEIGSGNQIFANVSRSYEPPLILELASFGAPGFLPLEAQSTWQFEVGSRGRSGLLQWDVALYDAEIENEIINSNPRPFAGAPFTIPSFRNAAETRHRGLEAGLSATVTSGWSGRIAYTLSDFRFVDDPDFSRNRIPGAPEHMIHAQIRYGTERWWIAPTLDWSPSEYFVNSQNNVGNDPYAVLNLEGGVRRKNFEVFAECTNLNDQQYSGTVQVDNGAGRFYEPSAGPSVHLGLRWNR